MFGLSATTCMLRLPAQPRQRWWTCPAWWPGVRRCPRPARWGGWCSSLTWSGAAAAAPRACRPRPRSATRPAPRTTKSATRYRGTCRLKTSQRRHSNMEDRDVLQSIYSILLGLVEWVGKKYEPSCLVRQRKVTPNRSPSELSVPPVRQLSPWRVILQSIRR